MSKLNVQQLPTDAGFLACFEAQPGHSLVYTDVNSLEPHVLTEFSQDKRMLSLYGPDAKTNDIYLYFGAYTKLFGARIREHFDPDAPTKEALAAAKKALGEVRQVLKITVLGLSYGMGSGKLKDYVNLAGFPMSRSEAQGVFDDYWRFFSGIKNFEQQLLSVHDRNNGYIINGRGRPLFIANDYTKDIVNRFVQSTGHDILMYYIMLLDRARKKYKIPMRPWLVDEHDATVWEVKDSSVKQVEDLFYSTYEELNNILGWGVKFKGKVKIGRALDVKCD
jgi:hypothetical protein